MEIMRRIDPLGVDFRRRRRIRRKIYYSQGPNYIWHVDGYGHLNITSNKSYNLTSKDIT